MEYIKGFTWGAFNKRGAYRKAKAAESFELMVQRTGVNAVVLAPAALQDKTYSTYVDYKGEHIVDDEELKHMISKAHSMGLRVILKPTVNVKDGTWRAHINFFDNEVPCEPKWSDWFKSYTEYILHYAKIAEETGCFMFVTGCEMVQTQRRETEWRELIRKVKEVYHGLVTYNTDKYQEENVAWWDCLDVISSSGYYPINDWDNQLSRIEKVVKKYGKPFFFIEAGCPSRTGSSMVPNDWTFVGDNNCKEQEDYYRVMFEKTKDVAWIEGFGLWDWASDLYDEVDAEKENGYDVFGKGAEKVIKEFYTSI